MKVFLVFWFFFCAGWGYIVAFLIPPGQGAFSMAPFPSFVAGALTLFMIMATELWRRTHQKALPPSISLKPWNMPMGLPQFILVTFFFSGLWGVFFALFLGAPSIAHPVYVLSLSSGGLVGLLLAYRVFRARFVA